MLAGQPQVGLDHPRVIGQFGGRALHGDLTGFQHVGVVGHAQGRTGVLFHQQDRYALAAQVGDDPEDLPGDQWRQAQARFVEHQQLGLGHQRAAHCEHLPFAAGERGGQLPAALVQAREQAIDLVQGSAPVTVALAHALEGAKLQVVFHAHAVEQFALLRHQAQAAADQHLDFRDGFQRPVEIHLPAGAEHAHDRRQQSGLAGAVGADHRDDLPFADGQAGVAQRLDLAVGHAQILHLEQGVTGFIAHRLHSAAPR